MSLGSQWIGIPAKYCLVKKKDLFSREWQTEFLPLKLDRGSFGEPELLICLFLLANLARGSDSFVVLLHQHAEKGKTSFPLARIKKEDPICINL